MPSRSNLDERDRNGNRIGPRPTVGEADPATRRRMLDQRLSESQPVKRKAPAPTRAAPEPSGVSPNAARLLRDRGRQIDKEVEKQSK